MLAAQMMLKQSYCRQPHFWRGSGPRFSTDYLHPTDHCGRLTKTLTFWILVEACDVHTRVTAHGLGTDAPADLLGVRVHTLPPLVLMPKPGDVVCVDLGKDEGAVMGQMHITLTDGSDRGRATLEHTWAGGVS